ncbi:MAG: hypothetical protein AAGK97_11195, partial [Bacteroidota bacterium]
MKKVTLLKLLPFLVLGLFWTSCEKDPSEPQGPDPRFLASEVDKLGDIDLGGFTIPTSYDINGAFAPGAYPGQARRIAQLTEIVDSSRNEPIKWDIANAMEVGGLEGVFRSPAALNTATSSSDIRSKID